MNIQLLTAPVTRDIYDMMDQYLTEMEAITEDDNLTLTITESPANLSFTFYHAGTMDSFKLPGMKIGDIFRSPQVRNYEALSELLQVLRQVEPSKIRTYGPCTTLTFRLP